MFRRVEIETDDRLKLFREFGIVADFERPRQVPKLAVRIRSSLL